MTKSSLLIGLISMMLGACTAAGEPGASEQNIAGNTKADTVEDASTARLACKPTGEGNSTFEDYGHTFRVTSATVDFGYGHADLVVEAEDVDRGYRTTRRFPAGEAEDIWIGRDSAEVGWLEEDTWLYVTSLDGETYGDEFGLTLYEDFAIDIECERQKLSPSDLLRLYVTTNMHKVISAGDALYEHGIEVEPTAVKCVASGNFNYGDAPVGVCVAEGDLNCPNCSSAFGIVVATDDNEETFDMQFSVFRLASEL